MEPRKTNRTNSIPPVMKTIVDDVLSEDERFSERFAIVMGDLRDIFYDKIKTSPPSDSRLEKASDQWDQEEAGLFNELRELYKRKQLDTVDTERLVDEVREKLYHAAAAVKPAYESWKQSRSNPIGK